MHTPLLRYHGGKYRLSSWLYGFFPQHRVYVEPFGGAALVLLPPSLKLGNGKTQAKTAYLKWFNMDVLTTLLNRKGLFSLIAAEKRFKRKPKQNNWREFIDPKRAVKYAQRNH